MRGLGSVFGRCSIILGEFQKSSKRIARCPGARMSHFGMIKSNETLMLHLNQRKDKHLQRAAAASTVIKAALHHSDKDNTKEQRIRTATLSTGKIHTNIRTHRLAWAHPHAHPLMQKKQPKHPRCTFVMDHRTYQRH